jgi:formiminotetrahydrofolate cyclodeaminase
MKTINKQTIEGFMKELSSKNPTPGGGVVAALSGVMAASLIEMVCNLTLGKKDYEARQKGVTKILNETLRIKKRLSVLAEEDAKAFDKVMAAYKTKKENPKRKDLIKKALKYAIAVPFEVRRLTQELEDLARKASKIGNKNAVSDAKSAYHLAHAAGKGALENININKKALAKLT